MKSPTLVFDLDGTLAETAGDLVAALNKVLADEGVPPVPFAKARAMVGQGARVLIKLGLAEHGRVVDDARLETMFHDYLSRYEANIADHTHLYPGVVDALDRFEAAGWRLAVCTNKVEHPSHKLLKALGVADRFAAICGQDTFAFSKPDPRALTMTIEKAGGLVERAIMVGDSATDIATAKAARVPVVAVDFGYTDRPIAEYAPERVISHFDALWDAVASLEVS